MIHILLKMARTFTYFAQSPQVFLKNIKAGGQCVFFWVDFVMVPKWQLAGKCLAKFKYI